jgi:DNA-binding NtrC family response regulator/DNA-binding transcriptional ArsR family regulator
VKNISPTPATDLFLAGRLLLYRLTGRWDGEPRLPREIPRWGPRLTLDLERIAAKALAESPGLRFRTALEFREALAAALGGDRTGPPQIEPREMTVGRDAEIRSIEERLGQAAAGKPSLLWIGGPPGMGKTRLLEEARHRSQIRGLEVVEARFLPDPGPTGPLLARTLRVAAAGREEEISWLEPLAAEHGGSPAERARRAAQAYFSLQRPARALILDDLDLADRESLLLAQALAAEIAGVGPAKTGLVLIAAGTTPALPGVPRRDTRFLKPLAAGKSRRLFQELLRPLVIPPAIARRSLERAKGSPLRLRQIARLLRNEWERTGIVPPTAGLPGLPDPAEEPGSPPRVEGCGPQAGRILRVLAVLGRPATLEEIRAACRISPAALGRALSDLKRIEAVEVRRHGSSPRCHLARPSQAREVVEGLPRAEAASIHRRVLRHLRRERQPSIAIKENLARHLIFLRRREAGAPALEAARGLAREGLFDRAIRLLKDAASLERRPRARLRFFEEASAICEETGDHVEGAALLEPFYRSWLRRLSRRGAMRVRRRLALHYHRSGRCDEALAIFEECERSADPRLDLEDLVFVDGELAELYTLRGAYPEAEAACRRGLDRLRRLRRGRRSFRGRMEVNLRANLGHLHLRRLELERAGDEMRAALKLARPFATTTVEATILNNLGIVESQRNRFAEALRCYRKAERLLLRAGERRAVIEVASNQAILCAKLGLTAEARTQVARAAELLRRYPGQRLEFIAAYARGVVAMLLAEPGAAVPALEEALRLGRKLGDSHLQGFGEVYLAESHLACGCYGMARRLLKRVLAQAADPTPLLRRMARSRLVLLETLLGNVPGAERARMALDAVPRTGVTLLEAWNDLFLGFSGVLSTQAAAPVFQEAGKTFVTLKVPFGIAFARLGMLAAALRKGERARVRALLEEIEPAVPEGNRLLAVAGPLLLAEGFLFLGDLERSRRHLAEASSAMVGCPFLEIDWWLEFLRSRLHRSEGDLEGARRCLHRSLHTRDMLLQLIPAKARASFLAEPRFGSLAEAASRMRGRAASPSTESLRRAGRFEGMVGKSRAMAELFEALVRLRNLEIPVLIVGETGTGKELAARAIHRTSPRAKGRLLALHCASLPAELFEAELFGYEAGAFTGAEESRAGLLEGLAGGTLLLDAVGEMPLAAQAKLLRVLDERAARRLGALEARPIDVRVLSASSADLAAAVADGRFRADLYYRLRGEEIRIPPLRERREDIPLLARHFLEHHALRLERPVPALAPDAERLLLERPWPGNVRELETALLRALIHVSPPRPIDRPALEALLPPIGEREQGLFQSDRLLSRDLDALKRELERAYLSRLFREVGGDLTAMMERLQVKRSRLYVLLRRAGIPAPRRRRR